MGEPCAALYDIPPLPLGIRGQMLQLWARQINTWAVGDLKLCTGSITVHLLWVSTVKYLS